MKPYLVIRYHCTNCGIFHTVIRKPGSSKVKRWKCACGESSLPTQTCTGRTKNPKFGTAVDHRLMRGDFPDPREYPRPVDWQEAIHGRA